MTGIVIREKTALFLFFEVQTAFVDIYGLSHTLQVVRPHPLVYSWVFNVGISWHDKSWHAEAYATRLCSGKVPLCRSKVARDIRNAP
jgi:hypothetical protein